VLGVVFCEPGLQLGPEVTNQALGWPRGSVGKGANGVALDLKLIQRKN
jgi:hypothetical protein